MEKRISFFEFQSVKNVAKAIEPHLREQYKIKAQIEKLAEQYKKEQAAIDALEEGVVKIVGFHVNELVKKVVETSEKGLKITKYLPTDMVSYDDATKQFVITTVDENSETVEKAKRGRKAKESEEVVEEPIAPVEEEPIETIPEVSSQEVPVEEEQQEEVVESTEESNLPW